MFLQLRADLCVDGRIAKVQAYEDLGLQRARIQLLNDFTPDGGKALRGVLRAIEGYWIALAAEIVAAILAPPALCESETLVRKDSSLPSHVLGHADALCSDPKSRVEILQY